MPTHINPMVMALISRLLISHAMTASPSKGISTHVTGLRVWVPRSRKRDDIDIVDICTPGHLHAEIAEAALAAGKHVLVEKPLANTMADYERLVEAAKAPGAGRSMLGHNYRRVPALALARTLVADGELGEIRHVRISYLQDWLVDADAPMTWRLRRETAGSGVLGDLGSHAIDQLRFLLDEEVISAQGHLRTFVPQRPAEGGSGMEHVTVDERRGPACIPRRAWSPRWK